MDSVFTQTLPGPPPATAWVGVGAGLEAGFAGAEEAAAAGAAAAGIAAGACEVAGVEPVDLDAPVEYHSFTPPCPAHAPFFFAESV